MRTLLCAAILFTVSVCPFNLPRPDNEHVTLKRPANAPDLENFYRSMRALIGDSILNETAVALV